MNTRDIRENILKYEGIFIIDKTVEIRDVLHHIVGIIKQNNKLNLLIFEYDSERQNLISDYNHGVYHTDSRINREIIKNNVIFNYDIFCISNIYCSDYEFKIKGSSCHPIDMKEASSFALIQYLMVNGWTANGVSDISLDKFDFISYKIDGDYDIMPTFDRNSEIILKTKANNKQIAVEQPILINFDEENHQKFIINTDGNEHILQINNVETYDFFEKQQEIFSSDEYRKRFTEEEILQTKKDFHKQFKHLQGQTFLVVEYECHEDKSFEFHLKDFLDSDKKNQNSGFGIIMKAEGKTGILGKKVRTTFINEAILKNSRIIKIEVVSFNQKIENKDIII